MLLVMAWLGFALFSLCIFNPTKINISAEIILLVCCLGFLTWTSLLWVYHMTLRSIHHLSQKVDVDPNLNSFAKLKSKWRRVKVQLYFIVGLVGACAGHYILQLLDKAPALSHWIEFGVWAIWLHVLIRFTTAWHRDQRILRRLKQELSYMVGSEDINKGADQ